MTTYSDRSGYRLFQPDTFPTEVRRYLTAERRLLTRLARRCDTLVEVGCGKAEHLGWAWRRGMAYVGLDPCSAFLGEAAARARAKPPQPTKLICAHIEDVEGWQAAAGPDLGKILVFVPFNCLGNMGDASAALAALTQFDAAVLISCFTSEPRATSARRSYYRRAGYSVASGLEPQGRRFRSGAQLDSLGFSPRKLRALALGVGLRPHLVPLGGVGIALVSQARAAPRARLRA